MRKIVFMMLLPAVIAMLAFPAGVSAAEITVSAALSLKSAFADIGKLYEARNTGAKIRFNFGASGDLIRQLAGGAPVDVFASAAQKDMDDASAKGLILPGTRADFAGNRVVLIAPKKAAATSFEELVNDKVKRIAVGNPRTVPAGRYAAEVFDYYKLTARIKDKIIYAENVRQIMDYVARGEVDAGVLYATDAAVRGADIRVVATAPESSHKPVIYPIAAIKGTKNEATAKAFIDTIRSKEGSAILKKYGFSLP
ncbi:MAG TPA: molybdate ABC transporter substrate-binding protein [Dissulfurispiraceae bacterium]|nr:molybdate ABC transporter substrate-binding protein [Dissulfurispiraceae bacterium]